MDIKKKKQLVEDYKKVFEDCVIGVLVESEGLTVEQTSDIRKQLSNSGYSMKILKNRIAKIAAKDTAFDSFSEKFVNMRAFVYGDSNPVELAKAVVKFSEGTEAFKLNAGLMKSGEQISEFDAGELVQLSKLPSKEELIAKLLFLLNSPITRFARTLNEIPASFVRTLHAIGEQKNQ